MLDLASFDSLALLALEIIAWSNVGVAAAFLLVLVAAIACAASDCLRDRRAARRLRVSRGAATHRLRIGQEAAETPENGIPSKQLPGPPKVTFTTMALHHVESASRPMAGRES